MPFTLTRVKAMYKKTYGQDKQLMQAQCKTRNLTWLSIVKFA